jgi:hypothetical protein
VTSAQLTPEIDGLRSALAILAFIAIVALFYAQRIPTIQPGASGNSRNRPNAHEQQ